MNYQTMQQQARSKHQQLRQEGHRHRLARKAKPNQTDSGRSVYPVKLAGALVGLTAIAGVVLTLFKEVGF